MLTCRLPPGAVVTGRVTGVRPLAVSVAEYDVTGVGSTLQPACPKTSVGEVQGLKIFMAYIFASK